jgi:hypothetical protein
VNVGMFVGMQDLKHLGFAKWLANGQWGEHGIGFQNIHYLIYDKLNVNNCHCKSVCCNKLRKQYYTCLLFDLEYWLINQNVLHTFQCLVMMLNLSMMWFVRKGMW